jgi:hypothetical protein
MVEKTNISKMTKEEKKLISLKEAAQISGYSADYIGQLIRAGKITGKQVYINVAWMTTAEAVLNYKSKSKIEQNEKNIKNFFTRYKSKIGMEINIFQLFFQNFKSFLPIFLIVIISFILLSSSVLYFLFNKSQNDNTNSNQGETVSY